MGPSGIGQLNSSLCIMSALQLVDDQFGLLSNLSCIGERESCVLYPWIGGGGLFPLPTRTSTPPQSLSGFKNSEEQPFLGRQDPKAEVLWDGEQDRRLANKV